MDNKARKEGFLPNGSHRPLLMRMQDRVSELWVGAMIVEPPRLLEASRSSVYPERPSLNVEKTVEWLNFRYSVYQPPTE